MPTLSLLVAELLPLNAFCLFAVLSHQLLKEMIIRRIAFASVPLSLKRSMNSSSSIGSSETSLSSDEPLRRTLITACDSFIDVLAIHYQRWIL